MVIGGFARDLPARVLLHRFQQHMRPRLQEDLWAKGGIEAPFLLCSFVHFKSSSLQVARQVIAAIRLASIVIDEAGSEAKIYTTLQKTREQRD